MVRFQLRHFTDKFTLDFGKFPQALGFEKFSSTVLLLGMIWGSGCDAKLSGVYNCITMTDARHLILFKFILHAIIEIIKRESWGCRSSPSSEPIKTVYLYV